MTPVDTDAIARAWIDYWNEHERTGQFPDSDVGSFVFNLDRDTAWTVILRILELVDPDPNGALFQVLAASPTEDLIAEHGATIIDNVEAEALRNPRFKLLLGGVWRRGMPEDIWTRVEQCRGHAWPLPPNNRSRGP